MFEDNCGGSSVVECLLPKEKVAGPTPVPRSVLVEKRSFPFISDRPLVFSEKFFYTGNLYIVSLIVKYTDA